MNFKVVGFKMPQELSDRIDECVAHLGVQRTTWVRTVLAEALKNAGFPVDPEILKPKQGARNDLPNRITEAEKRAKKSEKSTLRVLSGNPNHAPIRNAYITRDGDLVPVLQKKSTVTNIFRKTSD